VQIRPTVHSRYSSCTTLVNPPLPSTAKLSIIDFKIEDHLGAGAFGNVFRVKERSTKSIYAVKAVKRYRDGNSEDIHGLMREQQVLKAIREENLGLDCLVQLEASWSDTKYRYFLMVTFIRPLK
jgi:serine/threonine protein kinase